MEIKEMKETKIAKENVEAWNSIWVPITKKECRFHKQTCQRWLEYLEGIIIEINGKVTEFEWKDRQVEDLKQAIKIYKDAGI